MMLHSDYINTVFLTAMLRSRPMPDDHLVPTRGVQELMMLGQTRWYIISCRR